MFSQLLSTTDILGWLILRHGDGFVHFKAFSRIPRHYPQRTVASAHPSSEHPKCADIAKHLREKGEETITQKNPMQNKKPIAIPFLNPRKG